MNEPLRPPSANHNAPPVVGAVPVQMGHHPFARSTFMRQRVNEPYALCSWCGGPARFRYWVEADDKPVTQRRDDGRRFCSAADWRAFYGL